MLTTTWAGQPADRNSSKKARISRAFFYGVIAKLRFFSQSQKWLYYCHHLLPREAIRADDNQPLFNPDGITPVYPAGFVHLPKVDAEYLQQLCAEQLITRRDRNGFGRREWQKMRERNEALDCYVYARAAAAAAGLDRFEDRHWLELEKQLGIGPPTDVLPNQPPEASRELTFDGGLNPSSNPQPATRRVVRSRWMT